MRGSVIARIELDASKLQRPFVTYLVSMSEIGSTEIALLVCV